MSRICNRPEVFDTIIKYFKLIDGELYRRYKHRDEWRRITGTMRKDYLVCRVNQAHVCVHHAVMVVKTQARIPEGMVVDHIDGNIRNNNASNLRIVTIQTNCQNAKLSKRSGTKMTNVSLQPWGRYRVHYKVSGKFVEVGNFDTIEQAIAARNESYAIHAPERLAAVLRHGG